MPRPPYEPDDSTRAMLADAAFNAEQVAHHERDLRFLVLELRRRDVPWTLIAEKINVTPQAAQQRFGK